VVSADAEYGLTRGKWPRQLRLTIRRRRLTSVATLLGTSSNGYDTTTGEVATVTDALSHTTSMTYDYAGNLTGEATPDGHSQSWAFNNAGLVTSYTDKSGAVTATTYDSYGRGLVGTVTQASGTAVAATTVNSYDNAGQLISVQDAVGNVTQDTLDAMGRTVLTTDGVGNSSRGVYDLNGNVTDSFDASGAHAHAVYSCLPSRNDCRF
jgi:YD repeat-containing protein